MSGPSHPGDETLLRYAAGRLPAGLRLLVDIHLENCPFCRAAVRAFEGLGGVLVEAADPVALSDHALADTLARIDLVQVGTDGGRLQGRPLAGALQRAGARQTGAAAPLSAFLPALPQGARVPRALAGRRIGPLIPLAPGVRIAKLPLAEDPAATVLLLRMGPGRSIPRHSHDGIELTHVIQGTYRDALGRHGPGDLVEADGEVDHTPRVEGEGECVCLVAFEGRLKFHGLLGIVTRPFL